VLHVVLFGCCVCKGKDDENAGYPATHHLPTKELPHTMRF